MHILIVEFMTNGVQPVSDRDRYLLRTMDDWLYSYSWIDGSLTLIPLDASLEVKRSRSSPKVLGSNPTCEIVDEHCLGVSY